MGRKQNEMGGNSTRWHPLLLLLVVFITCSLFYMCFSVALHRPLGAYSSLSASDPESALALERGGVWEDGECCGGLENLELWGSAVKWGTDFKFNSSKDCCKACKDMCGGGDGPCLCDSWVFCGDRVKCKNKFGECWLKKQKDVLLAEVQDSGDRVIWTSGLIFGKGEGIIGLETEHGTLRIKLFPDCAPYSVAYIAELLKWRHCPGCQFYRAEHRGNSWDSVGNHIADASLGPPYGLIQGTLEAEGIPFKEIRTEACPTIRRGSVAWVGRGPEFYISLANHNEWRGAYTVFGAVLPEDMVVAEKIAHLPTKSDVWSGINVTVLREPVGLKLRRISKSDVDLNLNAASDSLGSSVS